MTKNDFSSIVGKAFYNKDGKVVTFSADGTVDGWKKLRYVQTVNGELYFVPEASLGRGGDVFVRLIPAGVEYQGTDGSRTRLIFNTGSVDPEGPTVYYLDAPLADGTKTAQGSSTAILTGSEVVTAGHQQSVAKTETDQVATKSSEARKEQDGKLPVTGETSGLVAGLLGAGLLAVTAILRKRKTN